jgi:Flp pilus assembly protein TadG
VSRVASTLVRDRRGVAMTEFALVLPFLLLLYLGGWQVCEAITCHRKVTAASRLAADLATQYVALEPSEIDNLLAVTASTLSPFAPARTSVRLSMITVDDKGNARVVWSRATNVAPLPRGTASVLPPKLVMSGRSLVHAEVSYPFVPRVPFGVAPRLTLADSIYMSPRLENEVICKACN